MPTSASLVVAVHSGKRSKDRRRRRKRLKEARRLTTGLIEATKLITADDRKHGGLPLFVSAANVEQYELQSVVSWVLGPASGLRFWGMC